MTNEQRIKLVEDLIEQDKFFSVERGTYRVWSPTDENFCHFPHYKIDLCCWRNDYEKYAYIDACKDSRHYGAVIGMQSVERIESLLDRYDLKTVTEFVDYQIGCIRDYQIKMTKEQHEELRKNLLLVEKLNIERGDRLTCIERLAIMLASKREPDFTLARDMWSLDTEDIGGNKIHLGTVSAYTGRALPSIPGMRNGEDRIMLDEHIKSLPCAKLKGLYMAKARKIAENFFTSFYDKDGDRIL